LPVAANSSSVSSSARRRCFSISSMESAIFASTSPVRRSKTSRAVPDHLTQYRDQLRDSSWWNSTVSKKGYRYPVGVLAHRAVHCSLPPRILAAEVFHHDAVALASDGWFPKGSAPCSVRRPAIRTVPIPGSAQSKIMWTIRVISGQPHRGNGSLAGNTQAGQQCPTNQPKPPFFIVPPSLPRQTWVRLMWLVSRSALARSADRFCAITPCQ